MTKNKKIGFKIEDTEQEQETEIENSFLKQETVIPDLSKSSKMKQEQEIEIIPKRDFVLIDGTKKYEIKEGLSISIPEKFKSSLETEGVI